MLLLLLSSKLHRSEKVPSTFVHYLHIYFAIRLEHQVAATAPVRFSCRHRALAQRCRNHRTLTAAAAAAAAHATIVAVCALLLHSRIIHCTIWTNFRCCIGGRNWMACCGDGVGEVWRTGRELRSHGSRTTPADTIHNKVTGNNCSISLKRVTQLVRMGKRANCPRQKLFRVQNRDTHTKKKPTTTRSDFALLQPTDRGRRTG